MLRLLASCLDTTLSSILDKTDRLEIGRWLLTSKVSSSGFLSSGVLVAILKIVATLPVEMEIFISWVINGAIVTAHSFSRLVGSGPSGSAVHCLFAGASIPLRPWCISPLFQIPPYFRNFSYSVEIFQNSSFFRKISRFSSAKISDEPFFSHRPQMSNFLTIFPASHFPLFRKNYYFLPTLTNFPLFSKNSPAFYMLYVYFPPTLTMMHLCITQCPWTLLDAPACLDCGVRWMSHRMSPIETGENEAKRRDVAE